MLFNIVLVSKRFLSITRQVLQTIDFSTFTATKFLYSTIKFDSPYSLIKSPLKSIRYDALIRTTSFNHIDQVFNSVENLVIVGDSLEWNHFDGIESEEDYKTYNIGDKSFVTFPNINSMPNLKKLTVVGKSFNSLSLKTETGGLYLLKYVLANCGAKIEEFTMINQLSLDPKSFDYSLVKLLLQLHSSTLKIIRIKHCRIERNMRSYVDKILRVLYPLKDKIKIELYLDDKQVDKYRGIYYRFPQPKPPKQIPPPTQQQTTSSKHNSNKENQDSNSNDESDSDDDDDYESDSDDDDYYESDESDSDDDNQIDGSEYEYYSYDSDYEVNSGSTYSDMTNPDDFLDDFRALRALNKTSDDSEEMEVEY